MWVAFRCSGAGEEQLQREVNGAQRSQSAALRQSMLSVIGNKTKRIPGLRQRSYHGICEGDFSNRTILVIDGNNLVLLFI